MREYEFTFIVQPEISEEGLQSICEKFERVLEKHGSVRLQYDDWGRRRLAYEIQKFQKGHYLLLYFLDDGKVVTELERAARLDESVLRFLTVLVNDDVEDIEARKAEADRLEEERKKKAADRAIRNAEEAAASEAREKADADAATAAAEAPAEGDAESGDAEEAPAADARAPAEGDAESGDAEEAPAADARAPAEDAAAVPAEDGDEEKTA